MPLNKNISYWIPKMWHWEMITLTTKCYWTIVTVTGGLEVFSRMFYLLVKYQYYLVK